MTESRRHGVWIAENSIKDAQFLCIIFCKSGLTYFAENIVKGLHGRVSSGGVVGDSAIKETVFAEI